MGTDFVALLDGSVPAALTSLLALPADELRRAGQDYGFRAELAAASQDLADRAYGLRHRPALRELHATLALIYDQDFSGTPITDVERDTQPVLRDVAAVLEHAVLSHETGRVPAGDLTGHPETGREFVRWLKAMVTAHPAGRHPLYHEHLVERGTPEDMRLLLAQETNLDPRFDDILAAMQIGRHGVEKMEIAANYWDEMGNGDPAQVHTALFSQALAAVGADARYIAETFLLEASVSGNISAMLALSRRHYYKAVGYFGVTEYLAPRRFRCVVDAWRAHGLDEVGIVYHDLHIGVDAGHAAGWFKNVVRPLVDSDPRIGREIALGAAIRLNTSQDYLDALLLRMRAGSAAEPIAVPTGG
ncbi:iron-containing redox enzyme family protein [Streptomyces sp. NPDC048590]|uniref:iron-containing redox enzyme family protein n=1 Tax=Streptomyces sp. NPDC048590 TaxID=3365574 RepID=UPI00371A9BE7